MTCCPSTTEPDLGDTWAYGAGVLRGGWLLDAGRARDSAGQLVAQARPLAGDREPAA